MFCTDIEHGDKIDEGIVELAEGADLLIHEGLYTPEKLPRFKGWGHSSWEQAVEVADRAKVKKLAITHHDPDHDNDFLWRFSDFEIVRTPDVANMTNPDICNVSWRHKTLQYQR